MHEKLPVYLILMGNTMKCNKNHIMHVFDLKGSEVKREEKSESGEFKNTAVLKDLNFLKITGEHHCLFFSHDDITKIQD